jgi:hypothetical protein
MGAAPIHASAQQVSTLLLKYRWNILVSCRRLGANEGALIVQLVYKRSVYGDES